LARRHSSVGDIIFLAKVPNGAVIVDFKEDHSTGATAMALDFGLANGTPERRRASLSAHRGGRAGDGEPQRRQRLDGLAISSRRTTRSDSASSRPRWSGTMTTSLIINWVLSYRVDGN
jgi:hypothetical protein